jgi:hypothetical protein
MLQHAVQAFLIAAILAPFSYYAGQGTRKLGLPQITGYLISGIICGPYCLSILSDTSVADLNIIEGACLGIIGLAAGAELHLPELAKHKKQVGVARRPCVCCFTHTRPLPSTRIGGVLLMCWVRFTGSSTTCEAQQTPPITQLTPDTAAHRKDTCTSFFL